MKRNPYICLLHPKILQNPAALEFCGILPECKYGMLLVTTIKILLSRLEHMNMVHLARSDLEKVLSI